MFAVAPCHSFCILKGDHICHAQQQLQCSNPHSPCTPTCTTHPALPTPCTAFHNSSMHTKTQGRVGKMAQDIGMVKVLCHLFWFHPYTCLFSFRKRFVTFYYTSCEISNLHAQQGSGFFFRLFTVSLVPRSGD